MFWAPLACLLLLTACLEEETRVQVLQLKPASVDLRGKRIAVLPFRGMAGDAWHRQVIKQLEDRGLWVVPLDHLAMVPADTDRSVSTVRHLARQLQADWVLEGSTEEIHVNQRFEPAYDAAAGHTRYARQIGLDLQARVQLRDAQGDLVQRLELDASHAHRTIDDVLVQGRAPHDMDWVAGLFPWFDAMEHLLGHLDQLTDKVRAATQPHYARLDWVLYQDASVPESMQAVGLGRAQRWAEAAELYARGLPLARGDEARAGVLYNLGVAQALSGDSAEAARNLSLAERLTEKPRRASLCRQALKDNANIALAREQSVALGWSTGEGL